jgi:potassium-transporting ATPase KdpC subunit
MIKDLFSGIAIYFLSALLIALYCLVVYAVGHNFWPDKASGSLITDSNGKIRGSYLLAQQLKSKLYFTPRPQDKFSNGCDVALYSDSLRSILLNRYNEALHPYDISFITPSSSLLDPYITRRDAIEQALLIASAQNMPPDKLYRLIDDNTLYEIYPFFTLDIVNTTILNSILSNISSSVK